MVSGVSRALEPWVISTNSPSPAPTVSTATNVRPVVTSGLAGLRVQAVGLDHQQLVADHRVDLLRGDHRAGDFGDEHGSFPLRSNSAACRATINSSLVGTTQTCTRLVPH